MLPPTIYNNTGVFNRRRVTEQSKVTVR